MTAGGVGESSSTFLFSGRRRLRGESLEESVEVALLFQSSIFEKILRDRIVLSKSTVVGVTRRRDSWGFLV